MKKLLLLAALAVTLGGCQGTKFGTFIATVESAATGSVSPQAIYIARNAFDAVEVSANNYINLKRCPAGAPICRDPSASAQLIKAIRSGRVARNNASQFLSEHPNQLGTRGLYDALITSTDTIKVILAKYGVGS